MYNVIAYISFFVVYIAIFVGIIHFFVYSFDKDIVLLLSAIILGFGQIYHKVKTKPISQAIKELWNAKVNNKSNTSQEDTPKTYEEYKRNKK